MQRAQVADDLVERNWRDRDPGRPPEGAALQTTQAWPCRGYALLVSTTGQQHDVGRHRRSLGLRHACRGLSAVHGLPLDTMAWANVPSWTSVQWRPSLAHVNIRRDRRRRRTPCRPRAAECDAEAGNDSPPRRGP